MKNEPSSPFSWPFLRSQSMNIDHLIQPLYPRRFGGVEAKRPRGIRGRPVGCGRQNSYGRSLSKIPCCYGAESSTKKISRRNTTAMIHLTPAPRRSYVCTPLRRYGFPSPTSLASKRACHRETERVAYATELRCKVIMTPVMHELTRRPLCPFVLVG